MKTICCVLKSGGDFGPQHVEWLRRQCAERMPGWHFQCWSDMVVPGAIPLEQNLPKWWGKMEIYGTDFYGPALVIDLDTVFIREWKPDPQHEDQVMVLRDPWRDGFRFPERLIGGFLYLPKWARDEIFKAWVKDPASIMAAHGGDDQPFLHGLFADRAVWIQDHYLDQIVSYKAYVRHLGIQPETRITFFHGIPRPWHVEAPWIPPLSSLNTKQPSEML